VRAVGYVCSLLASLYLAAGPAFGDVRAVAAPGTHTVPINGTAAEFDGSDSYAEAPPCPVTDWSWTSPMPAWDLHGATLLKGTMQRPNGCCDRPWLGWRSTGLGRRSCCQTSEAIWSESLTSQVKKQGTVPGASSVLKRKSTGHGLRWLTQNTLR